MTEDEILLELLGEVRALHEETTRLADELERIGGTFQNVLQTTSQVVLTLRRRGVL